MENFQFANTLGVVWSRENSINPKLLQDLVHEAVLECCAIVRQNIVGAYVYWQVFIDKCSNYHICRTCQGWGMLWAIPLSDLL